MCLQQYHAGNHALFVVVLNLGFKHDMNGWICVIVCVRPTGQSNSYDKLEVFEFSIHLLISQPEVFSPYKATLL